MPSAYNWKNLKSPLFNSLNNQILKYFLTRCSNTHPQPGYIHKGTFYQLLRRSICDKRTSSWIGQQMYPPNIFHRKCSTENIQYIFLQTFHNKHYAIFLVSSFSGTFWWQRPSSWSGNGIERFFSYSHTLPDQLGFIHEDCQMIVKCQWFQICRYFYQFFVCGLFHVNERSWS